MKTNKRRRPQKQPQTVHLGAPPDALTAAATNVQMLRMDAERRGRGKLWNRAAMIGFATGILTLAASLGGCAAQVGSSIRQDDARRDLVNTSPVTVTVDDNSGERVTVSGTAASGYALSNNDETRWLYTGSTPVNASARRGVDGTWSVNMASGKDVTLAAERVNVDPATGKIEARGVRVSSDASAPLRAGNEALDRLGAYWTSRDDAARQVLIKQIETTGEIPKDLAPFIVQLLLGL